MFFYSHFSVKLKTFSTIIAVLAFCLTFSACRRVSEEPVNTGIQTANSVILTEETTQTAGLTSETQTEQAEIENVVESETTLQYEASSTTVTEAPNETQTDSSITEKPKKTLKNQENITSKEKTETTVEISNSTSAVTEATTVTTRETTVTTDLTLQSESPAETTVKAYNTSGYSALNYSEQKGIWISYLEYSSAMQNKSASEFRKTIGKYFDNVKALSFNTVYVQVRAFGDAYYRSELFPTGDRYNGTIGAKLAYDPLQIMIEEAHDRDLSVHAWINPMRLMTDSQMKSLSDSYLIKEWYNDDEKCGKYIVKSGDRWYLNPAYSAVEKLISDGIAEIVSGYDVDGIQIDDYFYPTTASSFDKAAYSESGTQKSLTAWRTDNINSMVKKMNKTVHSVNSTVLFGISPQGSVDNNYNELYADVKTWCKSSAYCDYILPQVYFGFDNAALPYSETIALWSSMTSSGNVKLVIGLAGYKIGAVDNYAGANGKNEWINNSDMLAKQIASAQKLENYGGVAIFRYGSIFEPDSSVAKQVNAEVANIKK
ncbi:MAG: glycoside hydrolase family 10 protein [Oscillospiraceae bacterium]